jgi:retron-type reverse transcriptase
VKPDEAFSFRALWSAAHRAARGKRGRASVARFLLELEPELVALRDDLLAGRWQPSRARELRIRDPKPRIIAVLPFRDRVVHQALGAVLAPRIERRLILDTYACRVGAGTHAALRRARAWARTYRWYVHLDVEQFFPSIDHAIVRAHLAQDVPEPWLRALCDRILDAGGGATRRAHVPGDDLFTPYARAVGLPLGNLTSQLWANRYLDPLDHLAKDRLRVRPYLRYMDDMLVFADERDEALRIAARLEEAAWALRLRLHPYGVHPTAGGVAFVGYRAMPDHVRVRRTSVARAERRLRERLAEAERGEREPSEVWASLRAVFGHWSHADTWRLKERLLRRIGLFHGE